MATPLSYRVGRCTGAMFTAVMLLACGDAAQQASRRGSAGAEATMAALVSDSAGVRIIDNLEHAQDSTGWTVDTTPSLLIGDETKGTSYAFGSIVDVVRLNTGAIAVVDGRASTIRVFDSAGTLVRSIGRPGQGPGELAGLIRVFLLPRDTIVAISGYEGRPAVVFDSAGKHIRSETLSESVPGDSGGRYGPPSIRGMFADGAALASAHLRQRRPAPPPDWRKPVPVVDSARFLRVVPRSGVLADYGDHVVLRSMRYRRARPGGSSLRLGPSFSFNAHLPETRWAVDGTDLYMSYGDPFEIRVYDATAKLQRIIRKRGSSHSIPQGWVDSMWKATLSSPPPPEIAWIAQVEPPPMPPHSPATDRMLIDRVGNLWVRSNPLGDADEPVWFVFDTAGVLRRSLRSRHDIRQIDDDRVVGVVRDSLNVQRAAVFALRKRM